MTALYTIGHSTLPIDDFVATLQRYAIATLVDIRTIPQSRRHPQFGQASLRATLESAGIRYIHMRSLGGLRKPAAESVNGGWRNAAFRGYADYMQTEEFARSIDELVAVAANARAAIMCAEAAPSRCHRSLVGDALLVRGITVVDILSRTRSRPHLLTPSARVIGTTVTYAAETQPELWGI
jgi:uncharacterized protein (DUF488 family)